MEVDESLDESLSVAAAGSPSQNIYGSFVLNTEESDGSEREDSISEQSEVNVTNMHVQTSIVLYQILLLTQHILFIFKENTPDILCSCKGACARKRGRGFCPCRASNKDCTSSCSCKQAKCKNKVI